MSIFRCLFQFVSNAEPTPVHFQTWPVRFVVGGVLCAWSCADDAGLANLRWSDISQVLQRCSWRAMACQADQETKCCNTTRTSTAHHPNITSPPLQPYGKIHITNNHQCNEQHRHDTIKNTDAVTNKDAISTKITRMSIIVFIAIRRDTQRNFLRGGGYSYCSWWSPPPPPSPPI